MPAVGLKYYWGYSVLLEGHSWAVSGVSFGVLAKQVEKHIWQVADLRVLVLVALAELLGYSRPQKEAVKKAWEPVFVAASLWGLRASLLVKQKV